MSPKVKRTFFLLFLFSGLSLPIGSAAYGGWETGAKAGFDTNVNRAVNDGKSDGFLSGYLSYFKGASGESRLDWTLAATLEGTGFARLDELDYAQLTLAPGLTFVPYVNWTVTIAPFVQGKAVKDNDQSAFAFGGKLSLRQQINRYLYTGQYYIYRDSRADVDTYSFQENSIGAYLGVNWTRSLFSEIGYEFSYGDSFRTISTATPVVSGRGRNRRFSDRFVFTLQDGVLYLAFYWHLYVVYCYIVAIYARIQLIILHI